MKDLVIKAEYIGGAFIIKEREWTRLKNWLEKHDLQLGYEPRKPPAGPGVKA